MKLLLATLFLWLVGHAQKQQLPCKKQKKKRCQELEYCKWNGKARSCGDVPDSTSAESEDVEDFIMKLVEANQKGIETLEGEVEELTKDLESVDIESIDSRLDVVDKSLGKIMEDNFARYQKELKYCMSGPEPEPTGVAVVANKGQRPMVFSTQNRVQAFRKLDEDIRRKYELTNGETLEFFSSKDPEMKIRGDEELLEAFERAAKEERTLRVSFRVVQDEDEADGSGEVDGSGEADGSGEFDP